MPAGWVPNMINGPVAPPLTGQVRLNYVQTVWQVEVAQAMTEEERRRLPQFNSSAPYWDVVVEAEYNDRVHNFFTTGTDPELSDKVSDEEEPPILPPTTSYAGH